QVALHRASSQRGGTWLGAAFPVLASWCAVATVAAWLVACLVYWLGRDVFQEIDAYALLFGFAAVPFFIWERYGSSLLLATTRLNVISWYLVIGRTTSLVLVSRFLWAGFGVAAVVLCNGGGQAVLALVGIR